MTAPRIITLLTDFGLTDAYVGIMKGVILTINPLARLVDLTHHIPPQDIVAGALALRSAVTYFSPHTIHVAVVDPGVGSQRPALVVDSEHGLLVGPDNGLLSLIGKRRSIRRIENQTLFAQSVSSTFHGRDVFAPVAAHLSAGVGADAVGPLHSPMVELSLPLASWREDTIEGEVIYVDGFGNLVTNIEAAALAAFPAGSLSTSVAGMGVIGPVATYATVAIGAALATIGSWNLLEIAVRNGNAAQHFAAGKGTSVRVRVQA